MAISAAMVKELREKTGAGMMDCKKALVEVDGDLEKAVDWLRQKGMAKAAEKSGRATSEGLVMAAVSADGKTVALDSASLDAAAMEREREVYRQKAREEGKPEQIVEKIAEGAVKKFQKEVCLMEQPYIRDDKKSMTEVVREVAKAAGGDIKVAGFSRIQLAAE